MIILYIILTDIDTIVISDDDDEEDDNWQGFLDNLDLNTIGNDWDKGRTGLVQNIYKKLEESRKRQWNGEINVQTRSPHPQSSKRLVVIDASNVAFE
jgi:hypothetical protein